MSSEDLAKLKIDHAEKSVNFKSAKQRGIRSKWIWAGLAAACALAAYVSLVGLRSPVVVEVGTVTAAYPSQAYTLLTATGYVVPQRKADVSSKATGRLEWLGVEAGSIVKRDEIIARLENRDMLAEAERARANIAVTKAQLGQANAELYDAKLGLQRARELIKKRYVTQEVYDAALARFRKAEAVVESAKSAITAAEAASRSADVAVDYTVIRAPFDGVVTVKNANVGDIVAPFSSAGQSKAAVVSMADLNTLEVEVDVSEANLQKVKQGQPCEIQLDALPDVRLRGVVKTIVPTVDKTKATVLVKVSFEDRDRRVLPDMSAKVAFLSQALTPGQQDVLTVVAPSAVQKQNDKSVVFVVRDGRAHAVTIETGSRLGDWVVVKAGLEIGEKIVISDVAGLTDGVPVTPKSS